MANYETPETFAAAVYTPKETDRSALREFVAELKADEVSEAGILLESHVKPGESKRTIDSVDIITGQRIPIKKPMPSEDECGLNVSNLVETSATLRAALDIRPDLVVVEKFGEQEQNGEGLLDEIMQIIIEGIPLLVAVPEPALDNWRKLVDGMGTTIGLTGPEMKDWWSDVVGQ